MWLLSCLVQARKTGNGKNFDRRLKKRMEFFWSGVGSRFVEKLPAAVSTAWYFRRFVIAEMAFACRLAPRTLAQYINLAFGSRHRYQLFQQGTAAMRATYYRSRSDQQLENFVTMITMIIVDRHISSCRLTYKMFACGRYKQNKCL